MSRHLDEDMHKTNEIYLELPIDIQEAILDRPGWNLYHGKDGLMIKRNLNLKCLLSQISADRFKRLLRQAKNQG